MHTQEVWKQEATYSHTLFHRQQYCIAKTAAIQKQSSGGTTEGWPTTWSQHTVPARFWEMSNVIMDQVSLGRNSGVCFFSCCQTNTEVGWLGPLWALSSPLSSIFLVSFSHHSTVVKTARKTNWGAEKCQGSSVMMTYLYTLWYCMHSCMSVLKREPCLQVV